MQTPSPTSPNNFPFVSLSPTDNKSPEASQPSTSGIQGQLGKRQASNATTSHAHITAPAEASPQHPLSEKSVSPVAGTSGIKKQRLGETQSSSSSEGSPLPSAKEAETKAEFMENNAVRLANQYIVYASHLGNLFQAKALTTAEIESYMEEEAHQYISAQKAVNDAQLAKEQARTLKVAEEKDTTSSESESHQTKSALDKAPKKAGLTCPKCKKVLKNKRILESHIRSHKLDKTYQCKVCNESFKYKRDLNEHAAVHSKEAAFKCSVCNKCIRYKRNINQHMRTHSEERMYRCKNCDKTFKQKAHLQRHKKTVHSNEKPYQCENCNLHLKTRDSLRAHIKNKHSHP